jgi:GNAT superfamily N-acetyltransferase
MWRPDQGTFGPQPVSDQDIDALNRIFSEAFTDRYRRDGLVGVRVPQLNRDIWRYALRDAGSGAMVWRDEHHDIVAFNIAHQSGLEGWMGPLAVRPDRQGLGVGKAVVQTAADWLRERGVRTVGLETMPRTVENIGFYSRLGFIPGHLTVTLTCDVSHRGARGRYTRLAELPARDRAPALERCRSRLQQSAPGYDFTREHELTADLDIGDTLIIDDGGVRGFALWHSAPLAEARASDELRVLKLFADSDETFDRLIGSIESVAVRLKLRRVALRCQTAYGTAYNALVRRGYRVRWTDLRMTLAGFPEVAVPQGEVLLSNWEI